MPVLPKTGRARNLRRTMTEPEWRLWHSLKGRAVGGAKFVRQHPIGQYIVDFCCREARIVIELDGWTHGSPTEIAKDISRSEALEAQGYRVIRFHNDEVMRNMDGVLETILLHLHS